jgi:hypothetical protein
MLGKDYLETSKPEFLILRRSRNCSGRLCRPPQGIEGFYRLSIVKTDRLCRLPPQSQIRIVPPFRKGNPLGVAVSMKLLRTP